MNHKVAILMCTYNGQEFLSEQLGSFWDQSYTNWDLWISDDGSSDQTIPIAKEFQRAHPDHRVHIVDGPHQGFSRNFLSLVTRPEIEADYFAFADQDDIWAVEKIERAVQYLENIPPNVPALYMSRVELVSASGDYIGYSPTCPRLPSFKNALIQNIAGGHAMVLNRAARKVLQIVPDVDVPFHDWWTYLCVAGVGGRVYFDDHVSVKYRQHGKNLVGLNAGLGAKLMRLNHVFQGRYGTFHLKNESGLLQIFSHLSCDNQKVFEHFHGAWEKPLVKRIVNMLNIGVYAQTKSKYIAFWITVILGKHRGHHS
jgi:glycosyltransferase involved in cell wall biosynthesis